MPKTPAIEHRAIGRYQFAGTAFIAAAFAGPALAALLGAPDAFDYAATLAVAGGSLAALGLAAWIVTRTRSPLAKARARAAVGLLLCMAVATAVATGDRETALAGQSVGDAVAFQVRYAAKFEAIGSRFADMKVEQRVTAAGLASPQAVQAGQAELESYRALVAERNGLLQTYLTEYASFLNTLPAGETRRGAEAAIGPSKQVTEELYNALGKAQAAHADAIAAMFSWALANAGKLSVEGSYLIFSNRQQQNEYGALARRLGNAERAVIGAVDKAQVDGVRAAAQLDRSMRKAQAHRAG